MPVRTADIQLSIGFAAGGDNPFGSKATNVENEKIEKSRKEFHSPLQRKE